MDFEGVNDAFITAYIDNPDGTRQSLDTDTHWRSNKEATWNYRMKFKVDTPLPKGQMNRVKIVFQAWDWDLIGSNDFICEWSVYIHDLLELVHMSKNTAIFNRSVYKKKSLGSGRDTQINKLEKDFKEKIDQETDKDKKALLKKSLDDNKKLIQSFYTPDEKKGVHDEKGTWIEFAKPEMP